MGCFTWLINLANGLRSVPIAFIPFIEASTNDVPLPIYGSKVAQLHPLAYIPLLELLLLGESSSQDTHDSNE